LIINQAVKDSFSPIPTPINPQKKASACQNSFDDFTRHHPPGYHLPIARFVNNRTFLLMPAVGHRDVAHGGRSW
jgi:hypothetical protein